jgi:hypothetical protein
MRPEITQISSAEEFLRWYWLKEELILFCRQRKLSTVGQKPEIAARIVAYLNGDALPASTKKSARGEMPSTFTKDTVIGTGWRYNPSLGKFFRDQCGSTFRFNAAMRTFIHNGSGKTLSQAIQCYRESVTKNAPKQEIIPQNEYNRHSREYSEQNPKASRQEILAAWWNKRSRPKN